MIFLFLIFMLKKFHANGFTYIELMVTLAILSILASATFPLLKLSEKRYKEHELRLSLRQIRLAIDSYKRAFDEGFIMRKYNETGYPPNLMVLVDGVENVKDPNHSHIYFLRKLPRDPFSAKVNTPSQSWGKRSYSSPPDNPSEGADVFDVYSLSEGVGVNGIPYREW